MNSYDLNKKLTIACNNGFNINQINKLTIKIYSNLSNIKIRYHLKLGSTPFASSIFHKNITKS